MAEDEATPETPEAEVEIPEVEGMEVEGMEVEGMEPDPPEEGAEQSEASGAGDEEEDEMARAMAEAMAEAGQTIEKDQPDPVEEAKAASGPEVKQLDALEAQQTAAPLGNLDFILDVPLQITVTLGHTKMLIKELLQLGQGSVVELEKMAGEPMDVLIGDKLVARGEVVVVNEKFGVRLTDIVSTSDRIQGLNG